MKRSYFLFYLFMLVFAFAKAQTPLTTAVNFEVKTIKGDMIELFPLLNQNKIVVLDFFSTSCGPCQTFAYDFQRSYENFGSNTGNVFFLGINFNGTNADVIYFDSVFNITLPSASGLDGGGNLVFEKFFIAAYPTVVVIRPDRTIASAYIWEPTTANINQAVINAGGVWVGENEWRENGSEVKVFPNPAAHRANVSFRLLEPSAVDVRIKCLAGKTLLTPVRRLKMEQGKQNIEIDVKSLKSGIYIAEITIGLKTTVQRLVVTNEGN